MKEDPFEGLEPGAAVPAPAQISTFVDRLAHVASAHAKRLQVVGEEASRDEEAVRVKLTDEDVVGKLSDSARHEFHAAVKKAAGEARRARFDTEATLLSKQRDEIEKISNTLATAAKVWPTPVSMLAAHDLGGERRTHLIEQLVHASPGDLVSYAREAISNGDRTLGSAVQVFLGKLPRKERPFTVANFAGRLVGKDHAAMIHAADSAKLTLDGMNADERSAISGAPGTATDKIARGLRQRKLNPSDPYAGVGAGLSTLASR